MYKIVPYVFEGFTVRAHLDDAGNPWFVAQDVCDALDVQNTTQALARLDDDERSMFNIGRQGDTNIINESGLYNLIMTSRKPAAKKFKKWVTSEVLPAIRKTGSYSVKQQHVLTYSESLRALADEVERSNAQRLEYDEYKQSLTDKNQELHKTKAHISDKKTATAMGKLGGTTAYANRLVKRNNELTLENFFLKSQLDNDTDE